MPNTPTIPILEDLAPNGFDYNGQYMVEFDADSLWYETSLTIAALALRQGVKTEYHVFQHFPSEVIEAFEKLGLDAKKLEREGLLSIWDSYTETTEFEEYKSAGKGWPANREKPLDVVAGAAAWVSATKKGFSEERKHWLHLDDNTAIFLQYNDEKTFVDQWRTGILPAVRARECPHFLSFPKGVASDAFYTKFEALCDGIIDLKTEEVGGRVERFLRIRRLKGKRIDSRWHRLEIQANGEVTISGPPPAPDTRRLAAVMFTDIAGYTALAQTNEAAALRLLQDQERLVRGLLEIHRGRLVKSIGDGLLIEFANTLNAVNCAVDLQQHIRERNVQELPPELRVRIGIHLGDVQEVGSDILGDAVNVASRIEPLAEPGGVCLSESVYVQVRNKVAWPLEKLGSKSLKGLQTPMEVYRVVIAPESAPATPSASSPDLPRLAVLPLANISPDPNDAYFADGMTEEMISVLSQISGLRVIARTSVGQYKGTTKPITQIGSELGVASVLEGSVRKAGDQLRITVQLIDTQTQEHRWAQTYDRKLENVFAIQAEVAEQTAAALKVKLIPSEDQALRTRPTSSLAAYESYLRGIQASQQFGPMVEGFSEAAEAIKSHFTAAIRGDPGFSAAHARLAMYLIYISGETRPPKEDVAQARELAKRAVELSPNSSEAHLALGSVAGIDNDLNRMEREYQQAIALNPSSFTAHAHYAGLLLEVQRFREAEKHALAAIELDPLWWGPRTILVACYWSTRPTAEALDAAERLLEPFKENPNVRWVLAYYCADAGKSEAALKWLDPITATSSLFARFGHAQILAMLGNPSELRELVSDIEQGRVKEYVPPYRLAVLYAELGEKEKALQLLEWDHREGVDSLPGIYTQTCFDGLRDDPRFISILSALNLPVTLTRPWRRLPGKAAH